MKIYGDISSGNCYKLKLVCALLNIEHEWVNVNALKGENKTPEYLAINPNGKIPAMQLDDGRSLSESNAILNYLAHGSHLLPEDAFELSRVAQWQSFEQYSHEPYIAVARFIQLYLGLPDDRRAEYDAKHAPGYRALDVMEQQLQRTPYLCGDSVTCADISLYAYTHVAHEGGFDLVNYPGIQAWIARMQAQPGYVGMQG
ncbi:glutathione S-transferase family protein [Shewanella corallii]|uniref:Glutathione S-transferase family protein n=1 Tax=Shewanella corallii TaxID=560080 RepID=A0ABT0N586_9GAMM|nr:glutathione S-transferase family protein [Shewanella corallii]MCL2913255.1 glutathione S-transferase family protein [Shewanella corallii]